MRIFFSIFWLKYFNKHHIVLVYVCVWVELHRSGVDDVLLAPVRTLFNDTSVVNGVGLCLPACPGPTHIPRNSLNKSTAAV
jgi:hypothetical protein